MALYLAAGLLLLIVGYFGAKVFIAADPRKLARLLRWGGFVVLSLLALRLLMGGRIDFAVLVFMGALMLIGKAPAGFRIPGLGWPFPGGGWRTAGTASRAGRKSEIETPRLRMTLDHDTGDLSGVVLEGRYKGQALRDLDVAALQDVLAELRLHDNQGAALLETYLDRAVGYDWRERMGMGAGSGPETGSADASARAAAQGPMTPDQARAILGVGVGASADEIKDAHRRLMKKLHPDQGGSTFLAVQINQAKDVLLK